MKNARRIYPVLFVAMIALVFALLPQTMFASQRGGQSSFVPARVTRAIDETKTIPLSRNTHPAANVKNDRGAVSDDMHFEHIFIQLQRSPEQEQELETLIDSLNDRNSPNFHQWLTPEELGARFGVAQEDIQTVTNWLESHRFTINQVYPNRMLIDIAGTAGSIKEAFHTPIHFIDLNGETHVANMMDPQIPEALAPVVVGPLSLHDIKPQPTYKLASDYTYAGCATSSHLPTQAGTCYALTPQDNAVIYNLNPLWSGGYSGAGQTIAIVEDANTYATADWTNYRTAFGLTGYSGTLTTVQPGGCTSPGVNGASLEAALDVEVAGGTAPSAAIKLISCADGGSLVFGGIIAIDNYINAAGPWAGVMSMSYGVCEASTGAAGNAGFFNAFQQAAAQGISVFVSSGDEGPSACANDITTSGYGVTSLGVTGWGETPYNVAVGGTDFEDTYNSKKINTAGGWSATVPLSTYWNSSNGTGDVSAKSYIPEIPWNDSCASALISNVATGSFAPYGLSPATCNNSTFDTTAYYLSEGAAGGGASNCATGSGGANQDSYLISSPNCQGYAKPSWQSVYGNPTDGVRDIPDVSLFAANGDWGHFETICFSDTAEGGVSCSGAPSTWTGLGGTSVASPMMAAIQALVNQRTGSTWGNPNPVYYQIGQNEYGTQGGSFLGSSCNSDANGGPNSSCVFNDVTQGDIDGDCEYNGTIEEAHCYEDGATHGVDVTNVITGATVINGGSGYTSVPTCTIAGPSNNNPYKSPSGTTLWAGGTQATCTVPSITSGTTTATWTVAFSSSYAAQYFLTGDVGVTVGGTTYTFVTTLTAVNQVVYTTSISQANLAKNLMAAINATSSQCGAPTTGCFYTGQTANALATATVPTAGTVTLTAKAAGYANNFNVTTAGNYFDENASLFIVITNTTPGQGPNYVPSITIGTAGTGYQPDTPMTLTGGEGSGAVAVADTTPGTAATAYEPAWGAAPGWDMATGLGSVNACNLVCNSAWGSTCSLCTQTATVTLSNMTQTYTGSALTPTCTTVPSGLTTSWTGAPDTAAGSYSVTCTVTQTGYTGSASGTFVISKAAATIAFSNLTQTYTGSALSPTVTTTPSGLSYSDTGYPDTNAGSYPVTATITNTNYTGTASGTFVITSATSSTVVTSSGSPSSVYGTPVTFTATISGQYGAVKGKAKPKVVSGTVTWSANTGCGTTTVTAGTTGVATCTTSSLGAGTDTITANYNGDDNNHGASSGTVSQVVTPAVLTVTALNESAAYGQALPTLAYSMTGFVPGDTQLSATTGAPSITTTASQGSPVGTYTITAANGTLAAANYTFGFVNGTLTIGTATSSTVVTSSANPSVYATPVTFTATITAENGMFKGKAKPRLSGNVTWSANTGCAPSSVSGYPGVVTCTTSRASSLPVGTDTVTATYAGDGSHSGSVGTWTQTVTGGIATTIDVTNVSPAAEDFGLNAPVTITAVLAWVGNGVAPTAANVTIGGNGLGTYGTTSCAARVHETITCTNTYTPSVLDVQGVYTETAAFAGDSNYSASSSPETNNFTINAATTTTSVVGSPNPSTYATPVTFTATITAENGSFRGKAKPRLSGNVTWSLNTGCGTTPVTGYPGVATCTTSRASSLPVGADTVTATYAGDGSHSGSVGTWTQTVTGGIATTIDVTGVSPAAEDFGGTAPVTITAVLAWTGNGVAPTAADVAIGGNGFGTYGTTSCAARVHEIITCTNTYAPSALDVPGSYTETATFSGDSVYSGSSSPEANNFTINGATTTTSVVGSPNPSTYASAVTFTATITAENGMFKGKAKPRLSGNVTWSANTGCAPSSVSGYPGVVTCTTSRASSLPVGTDTVTATYAGDGSHSGSVGTWTQTVTGGIATTIDVTNVSPAAEDFGLNAPVTITALLTWTGNGVAPTASAVTIGGNGPSGTYGTTSCAARVHETITCTNTYTPTILDVANVYTETAAFAGDSNYSASTSPETNNFTINQASAGTVVTSSGSPSTYGQAVTFTATITGENGAVRGKAKPKVVTGTVNWSANTGCGTVTVASGNPGVATCTTSGLAVGTDSITAAYSGDSNHGGSTGSFSQVVQGGVATTINVTNVSPAGEDYGLNAPVTITAVLSWTGSGTAPTASAVTIGGNGPSGYGATSCGAPSSDTMTCTATYTPTVADGLGSYTETAAFAGDAIYLASSSPQTNNFVIYQASSTTAVTSSANPSTYATPVTFTATINGENGMFRGKAKPKDVTGTVTWSANTGCGTTPVTSGLIGTATCTTSGATHLPVGTDTITATYSGDSNHSGSVGTLNQVIQGGIKTTIAVTNVSPASEDYGLDAPVTITAVLSWTGKGVAPTASDVTIGGNGPSTYGATTCAAKVKDTITCTATYTPTVLDGQGVYTETATFAGDTVYNASSSPQTNNFTINQATAGTVVTSSANPSAYAAPLTFTATITGENGAVKGKAKPSVTGTVTWSANTGCSTPTPVTGYPGVATCTTSSATRLPVGTDTITATYSGDSNHGGSVGTLSQVIQGGLTTTIDVTNVSPTNEDYGLDAPVTITAVLAWTGNGKAPTASDVTIGGNGPSTYGATTCAAKVGDTITCTATYTPTVLDGQGVYTETATFAGDTNYSVSYSPELNNFTINQASAGTVVTSSLNPSTYGQPVTLTATITGENNNVKGKAKPKDVTGSVTWSANTGCGTVTVTAGTLGNPGVATCTTSSLTAGTDAITATYSGDSNHGGSMGTLGQVVSAVATTITWPTPAAVDYGTPLSGTQLNATESPVVAGTFVYSPAAGTVLGVGSQTLSVTFTPTDNTDYIRSTGSTTLLVNQATSSTVVTASANPSAYATPVTFTATISAENGMFKGKAKPKVVGGTVTWSANTGCTTTTVTAGYPGVATCNTSKATNLPVGTDTITATYNGDDGSHSGSVGTLNQVIQGGIATTINVTNVSPASEDYGLDTPVTITAVLTWTGKGAAPTASDVTIGGTGPSTYGATTCAPKVKDTITCTATYTPTVLDGQGVYTETAAFAGDTNYSVSYSPQTNNFTINQASAGTVVTSSSTGNTSVYGTPVTFTATISGENNLLKGQVKPKDVSGSVTWSANTLCGTTTVTTGNPGVATCTTSSLTAGTDAITATYSGDSNHGGSTGTLNQVVNAAPTTITWPTPAAITYGTALSGTQLNATVSPVVAGTFVYSPAAGTVLNAGSQTLSVTFTPSGSNYAGSTGSVTLQVSAAATGISCSPVPITYGTPLSAGVVNCSVTPAGVTGTSVYTPALGTVLNAGTQTVSVNFMPGNSNYLQSNSTFQVQVNPASQTITCSVPAPATAVDKFSFTLVCAANTPVTYSSSGACTNVGAKYTMDATTGTCTETLTAPASNNYLAATDVMHTSVAAAVAATVHFTGAPTSAYYLGTFQVTATTNATTLPTVTGTATACTVTATSDPTIFNVAMISGTGTCSLTAKWAADYTYKAASATQKTIAEKIASIVTWATPAPITYGTALSGTQLDATASVAGKFVYSPLAGKVPTAGSQTLKVTFTPTAVKDYTTVAKTVTLDVTKAPTTTTIASAAAASSLKPLVVTVNFATAENTPGGKVTGTVTVTDSNTGLHCTGTLATTGTGKCVITFASAGTASLTAVYSGDANNSTSTSSAFPPVVY